MGTGHIE